MARSLTLLQICTQAMEDLDLQDPPSTIFGNAATEAVLLRRAATKCGRELASKVRWQALLTTYTFTTVAATSSYALPTDYQAWAHNTVWDRTNNKELLGPATPRIWQNLQSSLVGVSLAFWFRVSGDLFYLYPTPTSVATIAYDYYSRYYSKTSLGVAQQDWVADSDLCRVDGELMILGVVYYYKRAKGLPYADDKADYYAALSTYLSDDTPKARIDLSGDMPALGNLPDTGFGGSGGSSGGGSGGGGSSTFDDDDGFPTFDSDN